MLSAMKSYLSSAVYELMFVLREWQQALSMTPFPANAGSRQRSHVLFSWLGSKSDGQRGNDHHAEYLAYFRELLKNFAKEMERVYGGLDQSDRDKVKKFKRSEEAFTVWLNGHHQELHPDDRKRFITLFRASTL